MLELITCIVRIIVLRCEAHIGRLPHPYGQWVDTGDQDPLPDVELLSKNDQRSFDVLLHDPDVESTNADAMHHFFDISMNLDATASRLCTWLNDPLVLCVSQAELFFTNQSFELLEHAFDLVFERGWLNISKPALKWSKERLAL